MCIRDRYVAAGGQSILEVTSNGIGRDPRALALVAERAGVNIIAGCSYYVAASHDRGIVERSVDALVSEIVREVTEGIGSSKIRAGVIGEVGASNWPLDPVEQKVIEASMAAQGATGVPVIVHSPPNPQAVLPLAEHLAGLQTKRGKVVLSHLDERLRTDVKAYEEIASMGIQLGLDTFGRELYYPAWDRQLPADAVRVETVCALIEAGMIDNILLSQDICCLLYTSRCV